MIPFNQYKHFQELNWKFYMSISTYPLQKRKNLNKNLEPPQSQQKTLSDRCDATTEGISCFLFHSLYLKNKQNFPLITSNVYAVVFSKCA